MRIVNPFNDQQAQAYSNYHILYNRARKQRLNLPADGRKDSAGSMASLLREFILTDKHPCIIARAAMRSNSCRYGIYPGLGSKEATAGLSHDLVRFMEERPGIKNPYASFMAVFEGPLPINEEAFEKKLWQQLSLLQLSSAPYYPLDKKINPNPQSDNFGFSFGGKAFYVVGMHPNSSRKARQFSYPMLVFNLHEQFETLRAAGTYDKVKSTVRKNDMALQGSLNPMLRDFGQDSEAKQYSGRAVDNSWKCPYLSALAANNE